MAFSLNQTIDQGKYALALAQERRARGLSLAIQFDPKKHPRDLKGRFREVLGGLKGGESVDLPDGTRVTKEGGSFNVSRKGVSGGANIRSADAAADEAILQSARSRDPQSIGGTGSFNSVDDAIRANKYNVDDDAMDQFRKDQEAAKNLPQKPAREPRKDKREPIVPSKAEDPRERSGDTPARSGRSRLSDDDLITNIQDRLDEAASYYDEDDEDEYASMEDAFAGEDRIFEALEDMGLSDGDYQYENGVFTLPGGTQIYADDNEAKVKVKSKIESGDIQPTREDSKQRRYLKDLTSEDFESVIDDMTDEEVEEMIREQEAEAGFDDDGADDDTGFEIPSGGEATLLEQIKELSSTGSEKLELPDGNIISREPQTRDRYRIHDKQGKYLRSADYQELRSEFADPIPSDYDEFNSFDATEKSVIAKALDESNEPFYLQQAGLSSGDIRQLKSAIQNDELKMLPGGLDTLIPVLEDNFNYGETLDSNERRTLDRIINRITRGGTIR